MVFPLPMGHRTLARPTTRLFERMMGMMAMEVMVMVMYPWVIL
jgi:hypothetical protein